MARKIFEALIYIGMILIFISCTNSSDNDAFEFDETEDTESIESLLQNEEGTVDSFMMYSEDWESEDESETNQFVREITQRTVSYEINYVNANYAEVLKSVYFEGILHLLTPDSVHYEKSFEESAQHSFDLERHPTDHNGHRGWRIIKTSGKEFWSDDHLTSIESVRLTCTELDTTITSISEKVDIENLVKLPRNEEITLTVTTNSEDDQLFLHLPFFQRLPFENNEDGTYSVTFVTPTFGRIRRFGIDAMSYDTLNNLETGYDVHGWGILFSLENLE